MTCKAALLLTALACTARAAEIQVVTTAFLAEPGLVAPVIDVRSVSFDGRMWQVGVSGWTATGFWGRPTDRGRMIFASVSLTPYDAHSSRRMYRDFRRARDLEFDDAAYVARAGTRLRSNRLMSTEASAVIGKEVLGHDAVEALRRRWSRPYAGLQITQRYRDVTAENPFTGQIHGMDAALAMEGYAGGRAWTRVTLSETAGRPVGRFHIQETAAAMSGSNLDLVNDFLIGGSWDPLGPSAMYGARYAEFRIPRGVVASGGVDYALSRVWELGLRLSALRAPSTHASGSMFKVTRHVAGMSLTVGAGQSGHSRSFFGAFGAGAFRP